MNGYQSAQGFAERRSAQVRDIPGSQADIARAKGNVARRERAELEAAARRSSPQGWAQEPERLSLGVLEDKALILEQRLLDAARPYSQAAWKVTTALRALRHARQRGLNLAPYLDALTAAYGEGEALEGAYVEVRFEGDRVIIVG